jgi:hypothetical protein
MLTFDVLQGLSVRSLKCRQRETLDVETYWKRSLNRVTRVSGVLLSQEIHGVINDRGGEERTIRSNPHDEVSALSLRYESKSPENIALGPAVASNT